MSSAGQATGLRGAGLHPPRVRGPGPLGPMGPMHSCHQKALPQTCGCRQECSERWLHILLVSVALRSSGGRERWPLCGPSVTLPSPPRATGSGSQEGKPVPGSLVVLSSCISQQSHLRTEWQVKTVLQQSAHTTHVCSCACTCTGMHMWMHTGAQIEVHRCVCTCMHTGVQFTCTHTTVCITCTWVHALTCPRCTHVCTHLQLWGQFPEQNPRWLLSSPLQSLTWFRGTGGKAGG